MAKATGAELMACSLELLADLNFRTLALGCITGAPAGVELTY